MKFTIDNSFQQMENPKHKQTVEDKPKLYKSPRFAISHVRDLTAQ